MTQISKCGRCGGDIQVVARPNRMTSYKGLQIEIPATFKIPTCLNCREEYTNAEIAERLDQALEVEYQRKSQDGFRLRPTAVEEE